MMNGAINELSSAVSGSRPAPASTAAAAREHVMAVSRDYISQPRLSESVVHVCLFVMSPQIKTSESITSACINFCLLLIMKTPDDDGS